MTITKSKRSGITWYPTKDIVHSFIALGNPREHLDGAHEKRQIYDDQHGIVVTEVLQKSKEGGGAKKRKRR